MASRVDTSYNSDWNCIVNTFHGAVDEQSVSMMVRKMIEISEVYKCKRVIHDISGAENKFSITDLYYLPSKVAAKGFDRTWKRAIIVKELFEEVEFYEDTANNQGVQVKVFTKIEDALKWL